MEKLQKRSNEWNLGTESVVLLDDRIEQSGKGRVRFGVGRVDANTGIQVSNA